jgi:3-dehydroquinate synthetase
VLLEHMKQDKKVRDGKLVFILAEAIGRAVERNDVTPQAVETLLAEQLAAA